jgi:hypothetical protein
VRSVGCEGGCQSASMRLDLRHHFHIKVVLSADALRDI